jgi:hypothetical protein
LPRQSSSGRSDGSACVDGYPASFRQGADLSTRIYRIAVNKSPDFIRWEKRNKNCTKWGKASLAPIFTQNGEKHLWHQFFDMFPRIVYSKMP